MSKIPYGVEKRSFAGQDLRHRTFDGQFFKLCDFRGANFRSASLRTTRVVDNADLRDTDLTDAVFSRVLTHDTAYGRTDVTGALWQGATLTRVTADQVIGWPGRVR